jgi:hypothetical protein
VREVLTRGAREGRAKFDEVRDERRRESALAGLGELVYELIERGEAPELSDHPEVAAALDAIAELEPAPDDDRGARGRRPVAGRDYVAPARRARFDGRDARPPAVRDEDPDGGAVSSRAWRPPAPSTPGDGRVWRPARAQVDAPVDEPKREPAKEPGARFLVRDGARRTAAPRGGIAFEDDEDLAEYMNPDDVPPADKK